jgi:general secretion pathway protein N
MMAKPAIMLPLMALLTATSAFEWLTPAASVQPPPSQAPAQARLAAPVAPARHSSQYLSTILARPLFAQDRRPQLQHHIGEAAASQGLPRLAGIVIAAFRRRAIFEDDGEPIVRTAGGQVVGYTIVAIDFRRVLVRGPSGEQTIDVAFDEGRTVPRPFIYHMAPPQSGVPDRLNAQPPPSNPLPRPPNLQALIARQRQGQQ